MEYKLYLVDRDDHFQAAAAFVAADDMEAVEIAASVQSTCSDVARGYEVWRGTERLAKVRPRSSAYQDMILYELAMKRHDKVLDLADRLQRTCPHLRRSRSLLEATAKLGASQVP